MDQSGETSNVTQWELSKENILPLKQGRKVTVLSMALDESSAQKLSSIRHEFEEELRTYSGNDPLDVWYRYAVWVEQNYPKGGKEGNFMKILEKCFTAIHGNSENNEKYKNDHRSLELWIKYANLCPKPLEIYQAIDKRGLCAAFADLYINWSWELEKSGNYRQADNIYQKGFEVPAQPLDILQEAHKKFQMRVARSTVEGRAVNQDENSSEPQRVALTALKPHGRKNKVSVERVGSSVIGSAGRIHQNQPGANAQAPTFTIFQDSSKNGDAGSSQSHVNSRGSLPVGDRMNHENVKKASQWNKGKVNQRVVVPLEDVDKYHKPSFSVHKDDTVATQPTPSKLPQTSNVLSIRKDFREWKVELFIAEPYDPKVVPQYPKHKVYCGTEEFSFEELRASEFFKKEREKKKNEEMNELKEKLKKQEELIKMLQNQQNINEKSKVVPQVQFNPASPPQSINHSHQSSRKIQNSSRNVFQDSWVAINKSVNASVNASHLLDESSTRALLQCQPEVPCLSSKESSFSHSNSSKNFNMTDPTVETKKALKAMDDLFCESLFNSDTHQESSTCINPSDPVKKAPSPFSIFQDENTSKKPEEKEDSAPFQIYTECTEENKPAPFQIFSDAASNVEAHPKRVLQERMEVAESKVGKHDDPNDMYPEIQDENRPPPDIVQPPKTRPISGILQPAKGIPVQPLDQQDDHHEPMDDVQSTEDIKHPDNNDDLDCIVPLDGTMADFTLKMPSNLEAFAKHAKVASTPAPWAIQPDQEHTAYIHTDNPFLIKDIDDDDEGEEKKENSGDLMPPPASGVSHPNPPTSLTPPPAPPKSGLSPIMEASREYISSSSSSGHSTTSSTLGAHSMYGGMHHMSRSSHNTHPEVSHETGITAHSDFTKSGYLADKSRGESLVDSRRSIITSQIALQKEDQDYHVFDNAADMLEMDFLQPPPAQTTKVNNESKPALPRVSKPRFPEVINPFSDEILNIILTSLEEPLEKRGGFVTLKGNLPPIKINSQVSLGRELFHIYRMIGEGAYAKAYLASTMDPLNVTMMPVDCDDEEDDEEKQIVLKVQNPSCPWEFYICHELRERLKKRVNYNIFLESVMRINRGYFSTNQSILVNQYHKYGTLLDAVNGFRLSGQSMPELLSIYYMVEVLSILEAVHMCGIIHADVKPDNFLIRDLPMIDTSATTPSQMFAECPNSLKLIDFGRSIDLERFPKGTTFTEVVTTDKFTCCEMRDGRPWTYQTDLYGAAAIAHLFLFGSYMEVKKLSSGKWDISGVTLKRYWQTEMWQEVFSTLLNVPSCDAMPDLSILKNKLMTTFYEQNFYKKIKSSSSNLLMMLKKRR